MALSVSGSRGSSRASVRGLFGAGGALSKALSGYESRPGQLEMAEAVERALREERILICEAGTGTGKTFAYLVPALQSGRKVVISTATRALQEQIAERDLPLVERALGVELRVAVMKGLSNYVCLRRYREFYASAEGLRKGSLNALSSVKSWVETSEGGDVAELSGLPEDAPIWREITASSETRIGAGCEFFEPCFVSRMRQRAELANVVIVNHHLFFADLALRGPHPGRVLPDYDAVIFDEAHELEAVATDFFGVRVSRNRIEQLGRDSERALLLAESTDPTLSNSALRINTELGGAADGFFNELRKHSGQAEARGAIEHDAWNGPLEKAWFRLDTALEALGAIALSTRGKLGTDTRRGALRMSSGALSDALDTAARRTEQLRAELSAIAQGSPGRVTWFEQGARGAALSSSPVDLGGVFRERIFESIPSVILTSATLSSGPEPFAYLRSRLGISGESIDVTELIVPSPFDFEKRALFYTPRDLPSPNDPRFLDAAAERIAELVRITQGGAFVLATSLRSMRALSERLASCLPEIRLFCQGEAPKRALIDAFRSAGDAVLVATMSFWQGVDVPGRALRLVVLEKAPFAVPTDPIVRARAEALAEEGKNPFIDYYVPGAALTLKQGFGRLIRTERDAGIVALLDERVLRRGYGRRLLAALPPARRTERLEDVRAFFHAIEAHG